MIRAIRIGVLVGALTIPTVFAACRELPREGLPVHGADEPRPAGLIPLPHAAATGATESAPVSTGTAAADPQAQLAASVAALRRDCDTPVVTLEGAPGDGLVFNNAMTSADAGSIDRMSRVLSAMRDSHAVLRCCFQGWARDNPDAEARLMVRVHVDGDGAVLDAGIDADGDAVVDPVAQTCATQIVREASFPPSPTASETWVEYPLTARSVVR